MLYQNKRFIYSCKLKSNVKLYQKLFLLSLNSIWPQGIFYMHPCGSMLPEIKLFWPKATWVSLIGDTVHNTGISLLLSTSVFVLLRPPLEHWETFKTNSLTSLSTGGVRVTQSLTLDQTRDWTQNLVFGSKQTCQLFQTNTCLISLIFLESWTMTL